MSDIIKRITNKTTQDFFPEEFSNEIYYSKTSSFGQFDYVSNLSIKYVRKGFDYYRVNNRMHKLHANQYLMVNSGNEVSCFAENKDSEGMSIFMDTAILDEVYQSRLSSKIMFDDDVNKNLHLLEFPHYCSNQLGLYIEKIFFNIKQHSSLNINGDSHTLFYRLAELMIDANLSTKNKILKTKKFKKSVQIEIYRKVMIAMDYLEANFRKSVKLDELSKVSGISKYYLIKCFSNVYGNTPHNFILKKRIKQSKIELLKNKSSILSIALDMGFADISSFSKCFKKHVGISPIVFQNKCQKIISSKTIIENSNF